MKWAALLLLFTATVPARATDLLVPFFYYVEKERYDVLAFLPRFLAEPAFNRSKFAFNEQLRRTPPEIWKLRKKEGKKWLKRYAVWLPKLYSDAELVDTQEESAMVRRMMEGKSENSFLYLLIHRGKIVGSLRAIVSTLEEPVPHPLVELAERGMIRPFEPEPPDLTYAPHAHLRPSSPDSRQTILVNNPYTIHRTGAITYISNYGLKPTRANQPLKHLIYTTAAGSMAFENSAIALKIHYPRRFSNGKWDPAFDYTVAVHTSKLVLTCDAENPAYERLYKTLAFHRRDAPFADLDRNGKHTLVLQADPGEFLEALREQVKNSPAANGKTWTVTHTIETLGTGHIETYTQPIAAPLELQFNELWPKQRQVRRKYCLMSILDQADSKRERRRKHRSSITQTEAPTQEPR